MEDVPIGLILEDEETPALETEMETLLGTTTEPPPRREAGQHRRLPCKSMRMLTMNWGRSQGMTVGTLAGAAHLNNEEGHLEACPRSTCIILGKFFYCIITFTANNY